MPFAIAQSATDYLDLLDKLIEFITSKSVTTVAPNNHGTGYAIGDTLSVSGGTSTIVAQMTIIEIGAVSATVSAGGTGYSVNDKLLVSGGTNSAPAQFNVDSVSSGVVTAVSLDSGEEGSFSVTPSNPAATTGGGGSGCTLTVTYGAIGENGLRITQSGAYTGTNPTSPNSVTGGSGSSATVDLTLNTSNGWTVNRRTQEAVSATVGAGGSGYAVNDQLTVVGGVDADTVAVFNVDSVSTGAVTAVSLVTAGKYGEVPANAVATTNDGSGDDACTLNVTWQDHISTDFDALLEGEGSGADEIFVGIRSFISGSSHNWELMGATGYDSGSPYTVQPGRSPGDHEAVLTNDQEGNYVPLDNSSITYWLYVNGRRIIGVFKVGASTYTNMYLGWINPFGTASDFPYPLVVGGCSSDKDILFSSNTPGYSGMLDPISDDAADNGPMSYRDPAGVWNQVRNSRESGSSRAVENEFCVWPAGTIGVTGLSADDETATNAIQGADLIPNVGNPGTATFFMKQTPETGNNISLLWPTMLTREGDGGSIPRDLHGELQGVYWTSADIDGQAAIAASEDTFTDPDGDVYDIFQNCNRTELFTYFCIKRE